MAMVEPAGTEQGWLWAVWNDDRHVKQFETFAQAETSARKLAGATGKSFEITRDGGTVARVALDSMGRVWTDVIDCEWA
jgi:hypothetical protein